MLLSQASTGGASIWTLLLPILLLVLFWVVAIRPQRKRQRETAAMQSSLEPGQQVMTGAGMLGTVQAIEDDVVVLEIAPGVQTRHVRQAIVRVIEEPPAAKGEGDDIVSPIQPTDGSKS
jgi:preprotein translocase subunit YajC